MSAIKRVASHYTRLMSLWPKDALRPTQPFTKAIEHRAVPFGVTPLPTADQKDASPPSSQTKQNASPANPQAELANINALYSLLENRYSTMYKLSPGVLRPASNPEYYERLIKELDQAPSKSWLQAKLDEWKLKIRWQ